MTANVETKLWTVWQERAPSGPWMVESPEGFSTFIGNEPGDEGRARKIALAMNCHDDLVAALHEIEFTPATMVNDSESLRHTIKTIRAIARAALAKALPEDKGPA